MFIKDMAPRDWLEHQCSILLLLLAQLLSETNKLPVLGPLIEQHKELCFEPRRIRTTRNARHESATCGMGTSIES